jgi:hypothetical protein
MDNGRNIDIAVEQLVYVAYSTRKISIVTAEFAAFLCFLDLVSSFHTSELHRYDTGTINLSISGAQPEL